MMTLPDIPAGKLGLLLAPDAAREMMMTWTAVLATRGPMRIVDGGNQFAAYQVARQVRQQTLPAVWSHLRHHLAELQAGRVPLLALLVSQTLSRELAAYRVPSPAAQAATQLAAVGKPLRPGQRVRFLYTRGEPGVTAWDLWGPPPAVTAVDVARYTRLLLRAASSVLFPLGVDEAEIWRQVQDWPQQLPLPILHNLTAKTQTPPDQSQMGPVLTKVAERGSGDFHLFRRALLRHDNPQDEIDEQAISTE